MAVPLQGAQLQIGRESGDSGMNGGRIILRPTPNNGAGRGKVNPAALHRGRRNRNCDLGFVCEMPG